MDFKINDILEVNIIDMNEDSDGIGKINNITVFVEGAIIGDFVKAKIIEIKKKYIVAKMIKILKVSEFSVVPSDLYKKIEGANIFSRMEYKYQLEYKQKLVDYAIKNIAKLDIKVDKIIGALDDVEGTINEKKIHRYRNKSIYPCGFNKNGNVDFGYYKPKSHKIIYEKDSIIDNELNCEILNEISFFLNKYSINPYNEEKHTGIVRNVMLRVNKNDEYMIVIIINADKMPYEKEFVDFIKDKFKINSIMVNVQKLKTNVVLGEKNYCIYGDNFLIDNISSYSFKISVNSFFQINRYQTNKLYQLALNMSGVNNNDIVWDLYSGVSSIGIYFAKYVKKVYAMEIVEEAVKNAKENAKLNNIDNIFFEQGDVVKNLQKWNNKEKPDIIIVDPPRKGLDKVIIDNLLKIKSNKILYISCKASTMARDLNLLSSEYAIEKIVPVDMFPHTGHVESVVLLTKVHK